MKFKTLYADSTTGKYISKKLNNGDWDYWLVLDVIDLHDAGMDDGPKYDVSIQAVSPEAAGNENLQKAFSCCGMPEDLEKDVMYQVEALSNYGIFAPLWNESGNNLKALLHAARKESDLIHFLFGFYMDGPKNGVGSTGWDLIAGDDTFRF